MALRKRGKHHLFVLSLTPIWAYKELRKYLAEDHRLDCKTATISKRLYLLMWSIPKPFQPKGGRGPFIGQRRGERTKRCMDVFQAVGMKRAKGADFGCGSSGFLSNYLTGFSQAAALKIKEGKAGRAEPARYPGRALPPSLHLPVLPPQRPRGVPAATPGAEARPLSPPRRPAAGGGAPPAAQHSGAGPGGSAGPLCVRGAAAAAAPVRRRWARRGEAAPGASTPGPPCPRLLM